MTPEAKGPGVLVYLELQTEGKFWEVHVDGAVHFVRFGKIGSPGHTKKKVWSSNAEAEAEAKKLCAKKKQEGYREPKRAPALASADTSGGVFFFAANENVTPKAIAAKLRDDGALSKANPRASSGLGKDGVVGIAIHPARASWIAVVDSADGAQGIGPGAWSRAALISNHLATNAVWYRVYTEDLALAVRFERGGGNFELKTGDAKTVRAWLESLEIPVAESKRPKDAEKDVLCIAIKYDVAKYRSGPDAKTAAALRALSDALADGDADMVPNYAGAIEKAMRPLARGVVRSVKGTKADEAIRALARAIVGAKMTPRENVKEATFDEEILRRAAELAAKSGERKAFDAFLDRLDAIETEAENRSSWAQTGGVARLGYALLGEKRFAEAYAAYGRLVRRKDDPDWISVNNVLLALLQMTTEPIALKGEVAATVKRVLERNEALGESAQNAVFYNLACVYARAGDDRRALECLKRCKTIYEQNPNPEKDTDLASLWKKPEFRTLLDIAPAKEEEDEEEEEEEEDDDATPENDRGVPRLEIKLKKDKSAEKKLVSRIGGLPNAPSTDTPWPETEQRPMDFVLQLVGKAAGGEIDLGDVSVLQVFADLEGDYYEENTVILHRGACDAVLSPPEELEPQPTSVMTFLPGADDRILEDDDPEDEKAYDKARSHAWCDKIRGIPVGANMDPNVRDSRGTKMECLLELVTYDDWFLWYVFVSPDMKEATAQIVRG